MNSLFRWLIDEWRHALTSAVAIGLLGGALFMYLSIEHAGITFVNANTFSDTRQYENSLIDLFTKPSEWTAYSHINPDKWYMKTAPKESPPGTTKTLLELSIVRGEKVRDIIIRFPVNQVVAVAIAKDNNISGISLEADGKDIKLMDVRTWNDGNARSIFILVEGVLGKFSVDGGEASGELIHFQNRLERMSLIAARGAGLVGLIVIIFIVISMVGLLSLAKAQKNIKAQDKQLEEICSQNNIQNKRLEAIETCNTAQDCKLDLLEEYHSELTKISERVALIIQKLGAERMTERPMNEFRNMARDAEAFPPKVPDVNHLPSHNNSLMAELEKVANDHGAQRKI